MTNWRDPQRLFTGAQRAEIAARQHHACAVCNLDLPAIFHVHHVQQWADGGPTRVDNGMAVCPDCHRRAPTLTPPEFMPRVWQAEAIGEILPLLRGCEFATLSAAPGAGKTEFAAWMFNNLRATCDVARMVVFGPNTNLRRQWQEVCTKRGIFLRSDSVAERRNEDGVVVTYHVLLDDNKLEQLINDAVATPTLFVLDEVHHLAKTPGGEAGAWAVNISKLVGTVDHPLHPVLNLSGTLFRSRPTEQISTIKYEKVKSYDGERIETKADYSVTAGRLISERQLRHIKVLGFDADMSVTAVELRSSAHAGAETIRAVDLDGDALLRSKVLPELVRQPRFIHGIIKETVSRLGHASTALAGAPVKALIICDSVEHCEQVYQDLVSVIGVRSSFIVHGQMPSGSADKEIERFRKSTDQAVMAAVQKITEGFDAPDVCVLTYLRTWRAPLFINQMVGRAMRITDRERESGNYLPATIIVPNDAEVKAAFADVLVGAMQVLEAPPEPCKNCGREMCACPPIPRRKVCSRCGQVWKACVCPCGRCGKSPLEGCVCFRKPSPTCERCLKPERYCLCENGPTIVNVTSDPRLAHISVDGSDVEIHLFEALRDSLAATGLPLVYAEQQAAAVQQQMRKDPMAFHVFLEEDRP